MKEQTANKFIYIFLYAQVVFSWFFILFGYGYALRTLFTHYDSFADKIFYTICFCLIGLSSQKLMLHASLEELREAKKEEEHE